MGQISFSKLTCGQVTIKYGCMRRKFPKQDSDLNIGITNFRLYRSDWPMYQPHFNVLWMLSCIPLLWKSVLVFFFNILVCGRTCKTHLTQVLSTLQKKKLLQSVKVLVQDEAEWLSRDSQSHHIQGGVTMDPCKVNSNLSWLVKNSKSLMVDYWSWHANISGLYMIITKLLSLWHDCRRNMLLSTLG